MKLPEWKPVPKHWHNDDDSKDFGAALSLVVPVLLIVGGLGMLVLGLLH